MSKPSITSPARASFSYIHPTADQYFHHETLILQKNISYDLPIDFAAGPMVLNDKGVTEWLTLLRGSCASLYSNYNVGEIICHYLLLKKPT